MQASRPPTIARPGARLAPRECGERLCLRTPYYGTAVQDFALIVYPYYFWANWNKTHPVPDRQPRELE